MKADAAETTDAAHRAESGVNALAVDDVVLKQFWNLASIDQDVREEAANHLVTKVGQSQAAFSQRNQALTNGSKGSLGGKGALECSPLMSYTLKRLVRGLGSSRQGARQGFALAITHLLEAISGVTSAAVLPLIESSLSVSSSMKATEARDNLLGQLFGCAAVVRAGKVQDAETAGTVVNMVLAAAAKKVFLREVAAEVILDLTDRLKEPTVMADILRSNEAIRSLLLQPLTAATPEALLLALRLWPLLPPDLAASTPLLPTLEQPSWPAVASTQGVPASEVYAACDAADVAGQGFFSESHLGQLLPVMRATTAAHPRLHQLWPSLLALLLPGFSPRRAGGVKRTMSQGARPGCLEALWGTVVEGDLFSSSNERKYLGFQLFTILLPHLRAEQVPTVFSPSFLRTLTNHRSSQNSHLHAAAKRCIARIAALRSSADGPGGHLQTALTAALSRHSVFGASAPAKASVTGVKAVGDANSYIKQLQADFLAAGSSADGAPAESARPPLVEQLCAAARLPTAGAAAGECTRRFLAIHAVFDIMAETASKKDEAEVRQAADVPGFVPVSPEVRELCGSRLLSLLGSLHSRDSGAKGDTGSKSTQAAAGEEDGMVAQPDTVSPLSDIVQLVTSILDSSKGAHPARDDTTHREVLQTLREISFADPKGLQREALKKVEALRQFVNLLMLYEMVAPGFVDSDTATDIVVVCSKAQGQLLQGVAATKAPNSQDSNEDSDVPWPDALLDILLAQLSRPGAALPTAPLRDAVEVLFASICQDLTLTGLQDLLRVLTASDEGQKTDLLAADADADLSEDSDNDEDGNGNDGPQGAEADSDAQSSSAEESDDEEAEQIGRLLEATRATQGGSSSESEDKGFDDEAMERLDEGLAAAVRAAQHTKPSSTDRRQQLANFKLRVVALLELYIRHMAGSPTLPTLLPSLLAALEKAGKPSGSTALAERLQGILTKLFHSKPALSGQSFPADDAAALLKSVMFTAARATDKRVAAAATSGFRYLLCVAQAGDQQAKPQVETAVRAAIADFFGSKKSRLSREALEAMFRDVPSASPAALPAVVTAAASARSTYLKGQAFALLASMLRPPKAHAREVAEAMQPLLPALESATISAAGGDFGKTQRHVEALKSVCSCWEALLKLRPSSGKPYSCDMKAMQSAAARVPFSAENAPTPKVQAQLDRLAKLASTFAASSAVQDASQPTLHQSNSPAKASSVSQLPTDQKKKGKKRANAPASKQAKVQRKAKAS